MKSKYRIFKRKGRSNFYMEHCGTGQQTCLRTSIHSDAVKLLAAHNQSEQSASLNRELAKAYLTHADSKMVSRTWREAIVEISSHGKPVTQARYGREFSSKAYNLIRDKPILTTTSDDLKEVLKRGGVQTNNCLRRLHNLALGNGWILAHIIPPKLWPKLEKKSRRAITYEEHQKIIAAEAGNSERRDYYQLLWHTGASQTDGALLTVNNIDWENRVFSFARSKTGTNSSLRIGREFEALLKQLPQAGNLFPKVSKLSNKDRAAEFYRRCRLLNIKGVSLHSYRYSWAQRAYTQGISERHAQAALGHKSRAVHHTYAVGAVVICPPLDVVKPSQTRLLTVGPASIPPISLGMDNTNAGPINYLCSVVIDKTSEVVFGEGLSTN